MKLALFNKKLKNLKNNEKKLVKNAEYYLSLFAHREMIEQANSNSWADIQYAIDCLLYDIQELDIKNENLEIENDKLKIEIQNVCNQYDILYETTELNKYGFMVKYNISLLKKLFIIRKSYSLYRFFYKIIYVIGREIYILTKLLFIVIKEDLQYKRNFIKYYLLRL